MVKDVRGRGNIRIMPNAIMPKAMINCKYLKYRKMQRKSKLGVENKVEVDTLGPYLLDLLSFGSCGTSKWKCQVRQYIFKFGNQGGNLDQRCRVESCQHMRCN